MRGVSADPLATARIRAERRYPSPLPPEVVR